MNKIDALRNLNNRVELLLKTLSDDELLKQRTETISSYSSNLETLQFRKHLKAGLKKTEIHTNYFTRLVCVSGNFNIDIDMLNEQYNLTSPNTILIPPSRSYTIEALDDCEILYVFREKKINNKQSIYKELNNIHNEQYIK